MRRLHMKPGRLHAAFLILVLVLACAACRKDVEPAHATAVAGTAAMREVKTQIVQEEAWERTLRAVGSLAAFEQATLSTKVPGRLETLAVDLGTRVRRGDLVARIDARDYELRLQQAEAALQQARVRLGLAPEGDDDRVDPENTAVVRQVRAVLQEATASRERLIGLRKQGVSSQAELDVVEAAFRVAQSREQDALEEVKNRQALLAQRRVEIAIAREQLADTKIVAPFDGATLERRAGLGDYLVAGAPVAVLARIDPLRLRVEVPEHDASSVRIGQTVRLSLEGDPKIYTGTIARTSPVITERNRMLIVEAEIRNPSGQMIASDGGSRAPGANGSASGTDEGEHESPRDAPHSSEEALRPGAFARAEIVVDANARTLTVPADAIVSFAGIDKVIAIQDGRAVERRVVLGRRANGRVEVLSGVSAGEEIVISPGNLQPGESVRSGN